MIDRSIIGGPFDVVCDFCSSGYIDTGEHDFHDAVCHAQDQGWKVFKEKGVWYHKCPSCAELHSEFEFDEDF